MGSESGSDLAKFHLHLLLKMKEIDQYPFTKLVIEKDLSQTEYTQLMELIDYLHKQYLLQTEEGFLDVTPLLVQFVGMLHYKLEPKATIIALKKEGFYPSLMNKFLQLPIIKG
ncbi:DUF1878 family protein [Sediminibacillus albus]|uniref:DUF1878 family protein n=1 Tax=Sediminibacillus albus TaxID=407036 RepID=A0A1G8XE00_9BACI|nr:DUF1878 family protein [Sediminibacillus albus]SDJ88849.1 Protein of unknown function [Sediminibacillus albus]